MDNKIDFKDFMSVLAASKEKADYEKKLDAYKEKPFLQRLFTRRPKDPAPGRSSSDLKELAVESFPLAFPEFGNRFIQSADSPEAYATNIRLQFEKDKPVVVFRVDDKLGNMFDETHFELNPEVGFIPQYQRSSDKEQNSRNRHYAYDSAMQQRFKGEEIEKVYSAFDKFRLSDSAKEMGLISGENYSKEFGIVPFEKIEKAVHEDAEEKAKYNRVYQQECGRSIIRNLGDYAMNKAYARAIATLCHDKPRENTVAARAHFNALYDSTRNLDNNSIFNMAEKRRELSVEGLIQLHKDEMLVATDKTFGKLSQKQQEELYHSVAIDAMNCGYSQEEISSAIKMDLSRSGIGTDVSEPNYFNCKKEAANDFRKKLDSELDKRAPFLHTEFIAGYGPEDSRKYPRPSDGIRERFERTNDALKARDFLMANGFKNVPRKDISPEEAGHLLYTSKVELPPKAVAAYLDCPVSEVEAGYNRGFGEAVSSALEKEAGRDMKFSPAKTPMEILNNDMADTVVGLNMKGDMQKLGEFCRDAGISIDKSVEEGVLVAAGNMYRHGDVTAAKNTQNFRDKWNFTISAAKLEVKHSMQNKQEQKKVQKGAMKL